MSRSIKCERELLKFLAKKFGLGSMMKAFFLLLTGQKKLLSATLFRPSNSHFKMQAMKYKTSTSNQGEQFTPPLKSSPNDKLSVSMAVLIINCII